MKRRVLIVSPHFPPINAPDHQRVRMSLPYFGEMGWEPHVLTVDPAQVEGVGDPVLARTVPAEVKVTRTKAFPAKHTKPLGISCLGMRSLPYLWRAGERILRHEAIDLVYFSTTVFPAMALGSVWRRRHGVPFVLDFQDPWLNDYYERPGAPAPPGGRLKYGVSRTLARLFEPRAMKAVSHTISVSPAYPQILRGRYGWLSEDQFTVLPFGAPEKDFALLPELKVRQRVFDPEDGKRHWVYVGVVGEIMSFALRALFLAVRSMRERDPEKWRDVRLHFVGTSYAQDGRGVKTVEPLAAEIGVADIVEEQTARVPYFEALKILSESDGVLLIGSDDPGYTASKIYPCVLARKPVLGIFHEASSALEILRRANAGRVIGFGSKDEPADLLPRVTRQLDWLLDLPRGYSPEINWSEFQPYTAREMTRRQCRIFDNCLAS